MKNIDFNNLSNLVFEQNARGNIVIARFDGKGISTTIIENNKDDVFNDVKQIITEVASIPFTDIKRKGRSTLNLFFCRMIFANILIKRGIRVGIIAKELNRDHSTIIYYRNTFENEYKHNGDFKEMVDKVNELIKN